MTLSLALFFTLRFRRSSPTHALFSRVVVVVGVAVVAATALFGIAVIARVHERQLLARVDFTDESITTSPPGSVSHWPSDYSTSDDDSDNRTWGTGGSQPSRPHRYRFARDVCQGRSYCQDGRRLPVEPQEVQQCADDQRHKWHHCRITVHRSI